MEDNGRFFLKLVRATQEDTGSPYNMPVDMSIVPHPHVHGAQSSGRYGFF